jgi:hypothetical protein
MHAFGNEGMELNKIKHVILSLQYSVVNNSLRLLGKIQKDPVAFLFVCLLYDLHT